MKQFITRFRLYSLILLFALLGVQQASADSELRSCTLVLSNTTDFSSKVEIPMIPALFRNDAGTSTHQKDYYRWQISLKYDDPRWSSISDGTFYWYIVADGKIIGPSTNAESMDDGTDNSASTASNAGRMRYKNESSLNTTGTTSSFTYFQATKGKYNSTTGDGAISCTFGFTNGSYEKSSNNGSELQYTSPGVQYWRNLRGIKFSLTYNATDPSAYSYDELPAYSGTYCYVVKPNNWNNIAVWAWDSSNNDAQKSSVSSWPGEILTETVTGTSGTTYYLWKMGSDKTGAPTNIIFNDGKSDTKAQTKKDGWTFTNGGVYSTSKLSATSSSDYLLGTAKNVSGTTEADQYEKFYAYGYWNNTQDWKEMDPVIYRNATTNEVDSVVYYTTVSKAKAGNSFDNFYFMFASQRYKETWDEWKTGSNAGAWDFVWRPEIFDNRDCNALYGALYQSGNDLSNIKATASGASYYQGSKLSNAPKSDGWMGENQQQSINPLIPKEEKDAYDSYILSLNVTTGTYGIQFRKAYQIVGPAVFSGTSYTTDATGKATGTEATCGSWDKSKAISLKASDDGSYYYTTVTLKAGQRFRFIQNNSYKTNYGEDGDAPSTTTFAPATDGKDVSFYNHLTENTGSDSDNPTGESGESSLSNGSDILFGQQGLKDGDTYETEIRFYPSYATDIAAHNGTAAPFYTIDRPITFYNYSDNGTNGYTSFACNYPLALTDNSTTVNVYAIDDYDYSKNAVTLVDNRDDYTHTNTYKNNTYHYLPANVGMILSTPTSASDHTSSVKARVLLDKLGETFTEDDMLIPVTNTSTTIDFTLPTTATKTGDKVDSRQYLFTWKKGTNGIYSLAFLRSATGKSIGERAYLKLTGEQMDATTLNPNDDAAYQRTIGNTISESSQNAKENKINLLFEDNATDPSTPTAIKNIDNERSADNAYYTLQGVRVNKPMQAGFYIHNGKKIIIR